MITQEVTAQVESTLPLTDSILQLTLTPETYIDYQAGQYLQILSQDNAYSFSIANAPLGSHKYELHIRHSVDNPATKTILDNIKKEGKAHLRVPLGLCHIEALKTDKPILFIAAGTGFAPMKAMIEQLLASDDARVFELYWSARSKSNLYMNELVTHWEQYVSRFRYFSRLSTTSREETLAAMVLANHAHDLSDWQIVLGGPFDMVYSTRDVLVEAGADKALLFSDAFAL